MLNSKRKIRLRKRREYWFHRSIEVAKKEAERIDLTLFRHHATARAVLVSDDEDEETAVWLPMSQITVTETKAENVFIYSVPEWLAKKAGLI